LTETLAFGSVDADTPTSRRSSDMLIAFAIGAHRQIMSPSVKPA